MFAFFVAIIGIAIFGGSFVRFQIMHIPITYIVMAALFVSYARYFAVKRGILSLNKSEKSLLYFELYGLALVVISFLGFNRLFISDELYRSIAYIPRQAYYLMFLPAILLFRDEFYTNRIDAGLKKNGIYLFWIIYIGHIIVNRKWALSVPTEMILCWLALTIGGTKRTAKNLICITLLLFTPIAVGGEMTNLFIRVVYAAYYFAHRHRQRLFRYIGYGIIAMVAAIFILPIFESACSSIFDVNSFWRLRYWRDELSQLVKSKFLGVGYGTSYATQQFVGGSLNIIGGPFGATAEYSTLDKLFVTGPHSSFIAIAFRLGLVGISTFLLFIRGIYGDLLKRGESISVATCFAFFAALIIIGVNVGLESPYYLMLFVFAMGECEKEARRTMS